MCPVLSRDKELTTQETPLSRAERIKKVLKNAFAPDALEIEDQSARHAGHAGARAEGETHYKVRMTAAYFNGLSRVQRQRAVHDALKAEFAGGLHALSLELRAPAEDR
jgi:BolA family transcriptional regulator, general stress-responsive regulator